MGTVRLFSSHVRWSNKEIDVVRSMYPAAASKDLLAALPGRSLSQIQNKANGIGVSRAKGTPRTEQQTREAKRQHMATRRVTDREGQNAKAMAWYYAGHERNKATLREYYAKRFFWGRAMKLRGVGKASTRDLAKLWKKQRGMCAMTGAKMDRTAQLDHITAKARGGSDQIENLQWVSPKVNLAKRELSDTEFIDLCRSVVDWAGSRS